MNLVWMAWLLLGAGAEGPTNTPAAPAAEEMVLVPSTVLAFDADLKRIESKTALTNATFTFWVTNVCLTNVLILEVTSSCGCTVARFPRRPWLLQPFESGPIRITMDLQDYSGTVFKGAHLHTSAGVKPLLLRADLPLKPFPPPGLATNAPAKSPPARSSRDGSENMPPP
jgi:hypothetical protein